MLKRSKLIFIGLRRKHDGWTAGRMCGRAAKHRLIDHVDHVALLDEIVDQPLRPSGLPIQQVAVTPALWNCTNGCGARWCNLLKSDWWDFRLWPDSAIIGIRRARKLSGDKLPSVGG